MEQTTKTSRNGLLLATAIFSFAIFASATVLATYLYQFHAGPNTITVTGSTQQTITSDVAQWSGSFSRTVGTDGVKTGTDEIAKDTADVIAYLHANKITDDQITLDPLSISTNYNTDTDSQGRSTQVFSGYTITQSFEVESNDIASIGKAATASGSLIAQGILFQTSNPSYYYSKLADLKIQLLSSATQDAKSRAQKVADNTNSSLGKLRSATMGVTQITSPNSSDISESGYYDTSSIKKDVTVIVHATFFVQ